MNTTVCLFANTLTYPDGGGHRWVYLNWALGLRAAGCRVIWMEAVAPTAPSHEARTQVGVLKHQLERYGLAESVALCSWTQRRVPESLLDGCLDIAGAEDADLLLNLGYSLPSSVVKRFKRSALVDIDPGLLQVWLSTGAVKVARHNVYFTIGETVGQPAARFPDAGLAWHYTPPCVALDWWPARSSPAHMPFTTVTHWYSTDGWMEDAEGAYPNDKRDGFLPFLDLPKHTIHPLELALCLGPDEPDDRNMLVANGWGLREAESVSSTPWDYQHYIQQSRGEFSCVKPSCVRLQNAWISDRTLCYLASGKPAVVEHTGPSRFLPDAAGLFRFRTLEEAARALDTVAGDYEHQCRLARQLAKEYFDAKKVAEHVLERALA